MPFNRSGAPTPEMLHVWTYPGLEAYGELASKVGKVTVKAESTGVIKAYSYAGVGAAGAAPGEEVATWQLPTANSQLPLTSPLRRKCLPRLLRQQGPVDHGPTSTFCLASAAASAFSSRVADIAHASPAVRGGLPMRCTP